MRVLERGGRARLALEALERLRVRGDLLGQELQGDLASQPRVFRAVDDAHPAAAQLLDYPVTGNGLADHGSGLLSLAELGSPVLDERVAGCAVGPAEGDAAAALNCAKVPAGDGHG